MTTHPTYPLIRERNLILALLLILAALAWAILIWQSQMTSDTMMSPTMGLSGPVFIAIWVTMMIAMMFPTGAPMILMFSTVHANRQHKGQSFVPTWVFVSAYMLIWTIFGVLAFAVASGAEFLARQLFWLMENAARIGGIVLILAGVYQLSPLKNMCLTKCRTPLAFILTSWRDGYTGAFRMGLEHGTYCLGCCWLLFVILFPLGVMNVAAMAVITLLIFAEKSLPLSRLSGQIAAFIPIAYGLMIVITPNLLATMM